MSLILALVGVGLAGGIHAGIPVRGVQGLGEPTFVGVDMGWTAPAPGGLVRVYVGQDEASASRWLNSSIPLSAGRPPAMNYADEAWGDGQGILAFRDGNVAVFVRADDAHAVADRLRLSIVDDGSAWPTAPTLSQQDGRWTLSVPAGDAVSFQGGRLAPGPGWTFTELPHELVVWDAVGRPVQVR